MKNLAGKYTVLEPIRETHFSKVFKVQNLNGKLFAAKVIQKDSDSLYVLANCFNKYVTMNKSCFERSNQHERTN
jgi:hypothetical protein